MNELIASPVLTFTVKIPVLVVEPAGLVTVMGPVVAPAGTLA